MVFGGFDSSDHKEVIMGWWRKLKIWQKAGMIVGGIYLVVYMTLFLLGLFSPPGESGIGYLLVFMAWPWIGILIMFGVGPGTYTSMIFIGIFSALMYSLSIMLLFRLSSFMFLTFRYLKGLKS
jgi:hypothetical protein